jgi:hypothetical protein
LGFQERTQERERSSGRGIGVVEERVKLDGQPPVVPRGADGRHDFGKINGARAGDKVMVNAAGSDILDVVMPDVARQPGDAPG